MADLTAEGTVIEVGRKDGTSAKGDWTKWSFNLQHHDTGQKHWYSWFSTEGAAIKTNKSYVFNFTTADNPQNADHPYRNINSVEEITDHSDVEELFGDPREQEPQGRTESLNAGIPDYLDTDVRIRIGQATNLARELIDPVFSGDLMHLDDWCQEMCRIRDGVFWRLLDVKVKPQHWCYQHDVARRVTKAGSYVHEVGDKWCSEDGLFDAQGQPVNQEPETNELPF